MARKKAFTLVELLVVISIIALLMSILMPALSRAKKQARATACKMNLHQWSLIWSLYCEDNDRKFSYFSGPGWPRGLWILALRSQWNTQSDLLRCPMATKNLSDGSVYGGPFNSYEMGETGGVVIEGSCSYGANCWISDKRPTDSDKLQGRPFAWAWKTPDVKNADAIPVLGDAMWRGGGPFSGELGTDRKPDRGDPPEYNGEWDPNLRFKAEMKHFCIDRHNGNVNHLFMDWSVRSVGLKELWRLKWHRQFNTNGPWTPRPAYTPDWPPWMKNFKEY